MQNIKRNILIFFLISLVILSTILIIFFANKKNSIVESKMENNDIINEKFEDIYSSEIPKDSIYGTAYIQPQTIIDLTDVNTLFENSDLVIVGTIIDKGKGKMIEEFEYPGIEGTIAIDTIIKGDIQSDSINFLSNGGYCTIKEYIDGIPKNNKEKIEKMGLASLNSEEQENNYLIFNYEYGKNFYKNQRYVLMLKEVNGKFISLSKYGFLEVSQNDSIQSLSDIMNLINKN